MTITRNQVSLAALGLAAAVTLGACAGGNSNESSESGRLESQTPPAASLRIEAAEFSLSPENLRTTPGAVAIE
jgi:hypothetical protein